MQQEKNELILLEEKLPIEINSDTIQGGSLVGAVFALAYGVMWLRKHLSSDKLGARRNDGEIDLLAILAKERSEAMTDARVAWAAKAEDARLIGQLTAQVVGQEQLILKTNNEVQLLRALNESNSRQMEKLEIRMSEMTKQFQSCQTCPLRRMQNETRPN